MDVLYCHHLILYIFNEMYESVLDGFVFIYGNSGSSSIVVQWTLLQTLQVRSQYSPSYFGTTVSLLTNQLVVGAYAASKSRCPLKPHRSYTIMVARWLPGNGVRIHALVRWLVAVASAAATCRVQSSWSIRPQPRSVAHWRGPSGGGSVWGWASVFSLFFTHFYRFILLPYWLTSE